MTRKTKNARQRRPMLMTKHPVERKIARHRAARLFSHRWRTNLAQGWTAVRTQLSRGTSLATTAGALRHVEDDVEMIMLENYNKTN